MFFCEFELPVNQICNEMFTCNTTFIVAVCTQHVATTRKNAEDTNMFSASR